MEAVMNDQRKSKAQLIAELELTRTRVAELVPKQADEGLHDLIEIIQLTEHVSTKIHGLMNEAEIFRTVKEEFAQSKRYITSIVLLTDDDSSLRIAEASLSPAKVKAGEKATGLRLKGYKIDLKKSSSYRQVVREGKTVRVSAGDIIGELFPRPLARLVVKILGLEKESSILTPLKRHGKIIGGFALTCPELAEHFIPTVRNLAQHISNALEWADEYSERKRAEETLQDNEEKYRTIVKNVSDQIIHMNKYGTIIYANDKEAIFGRKPEEIIGKYFTKLGYFDIKDTPKYLKLFKDVITGKKKINELELEIKHKDGHIIPIEVSTSLVKKKGKIEGFLCMIKDITERKQAEEGLRESEQNLIKGQEIAQMGYWKLNIVTEEVEGSDELLRIFGLSRDEMTLNAFAGAVHPEDREYDLEHIQKGIEKGVPWDIEHRLLLKDGTIKWVRAVGEPNLDESGKTIHIIGIVQDITERKRVEETLRESEERFRILIETSPDGILIDQDGSLIFANSAYQQMFSIKDLSRRLGKPYSPIIAPRDRERVLAISAAREAGEVIPTTYEFTGRRADGAEFPVEVTAARLVHNEQPATMAILRDITKRKQVEEELRESEERFRVIAETATDAIVTVDENMEIVFANYAVTDIFGYRVEEILGHSLAILMPEDLGERLILAFKKYLKTEKKSISWKNNRFPGLKKDGQIIPLEISFNEFVKDDHHFFTGMIRDATDRQRLEAEMLRSAKLESLGNLAGGLAHDFNNFLSSIMLNVGTARLKAGKGEEIRDLLQAAEQSIHKAKGITQQLLTFTRGGEPVKSSMSLQPIIEESVKFTLHGSKTIPRFDLPDDLWPAEVDPGQINQVINSLAINAVQAMPRGGHLTIRGRNVTIKKGDPRTVLAPGNYVEVAFKDDGVGIPPESLDSIFDPYYTTREEGTGLGLFSVFSIIERHGGWITVKSEVDRGTTFTFYLSAAAEEEVAVTSSDIMKGSGRVLIMDDDDTIRLGMTALLGELGYEVETTADGEEAIERYGEALKSDRPFDAVILDLTVPGGMGGAETIERLKELDPRVKAIVSSGYSTDPIMANYQKYGFKAVLPKPFQPAELSRAMEQVFG